MADSAAYFLQLNVEVTNNKAMSDNKFVKCYASTCIDDIIAEQLENFNVVVDEVRTASDSTGAGGTVTPSSTPVHVLTSFNKKYIFVKCHETKDPDQTQNTGKIVQGLEGKDAFGILMNARKKYGSLPKERYIFMHHPFSVMSVKKNYRPCELLLSLCVCHRLS